MERRKFLLGALAGLAAPAVVGRASASDDSGSSLPIPPLVDVHESSPTLLEAINGERAFIGHQRARVLGWSQSYLGPTLRMRRGRAARMLVANRLDRAITSHWHGLHVPGWQDGGPQTLIAPGSRLDQTLEIEQPAGTYWYHSHPHGETGEQVYLGLAGMLLIEDAGSSDTELLPVEYGVDDIPLIVQDRAFTRRGELAYDDDGMALMQGFRGDKVVINGAISPKKHVPPGIVRLRLLNASNSRVYRFQFDDGYEFHKIAGDAGLLPAPVRMDVVELAPAERVEILVDFSDGRTRQLVSPDVPVSMMGGGMMGNGSMGRMMGQGASSDPDQMLLILTLEVDQAKKASKIALPTLFSQAPSPDFGEPVRRRKFQLNMMMGMGMMGAMLGGKADLGINGKTYDMGRIDETVRLGETEIWEIAADMMAHPFHVHGTSFQVLSQNGRRVDYASTGLKDVVWVDGSAEILVRFNHPAGPDAPYMYHCHILEHEDAGMMGQFTVS